MPKVPVRGGAFSKGFMWGKESGFRGTQGYESLLDECWCRQVQWGPLLAEIPYCRHFRSCLLEVPRSPSLGLALWDGKTEQLQQFKWKSVIVWAQKIWACRWSKVLSWRRKCLLVFQRKKILSLKKWVQRSDSYSAERWDLLEGTRVSGRKVGQRSWGRTKRKEEGNIWSLEEERNS